jgi:hypothetical protein
MAGRVSGESIEIPEGLLVELAPQREVDVGIGVCPRKGRHFSAAETTQKGRQQLDQADSLVDFGLTQAG